MVLPARSASTRSRSSRFVDEAELMEEIAARCSMSWPITGMSDEHLEELGWTAYSRPDTGAVRCDDLPAAASLREC
jgi:hypothetical protein